MAGEGEVLEVLQVQVGTKEEGVEAEMAAEEEEAVKVTVDASGNHNPTVRLIINFKIYNVGIVVRRVTALSGARSVSTSVSWLMTRGIFRRKSNVTHSPMTRQPTKIYDFCT